jgi:hypothetical protein
MFGASDAKDVSPLEAFMTDDVRMRLGNAETVQGKPAFVEAVNAFLASVAAFRHEVLNVWSDGDALIAEFDVHYTRLDGRGVTVPCCNRVPAPGGLGCGVPQLHRRHARVLLTRLWALLRSSSGRARSAATGGTATGASNRWPVMVIVWVLVRGRLDATTVSRRGTPISTSANDQPWSPGHEATAVDAGCRGHLQPTSGRAVAA